MPTQERNQFAAGRIITHHLGHPEKGSLQRGRPGRDQSSAGVVQYTIGLAVQDFHRAAP